MLYDPNFTPPDKPGKDAVACSGQNFIELCERLTIIDEQAFEEVCRRLGLSIDWTMAYQTIDETARAISQRAFLHSLARGEVYQAELSGISYFGPLLPKQSSKIATDLPLTTTLRFTALPIKDIHCHDAARTASGVRSARRASR